jgi:hypothetical protein
MAQDMHALAASLGLNRVGIAGHYIGLMVAYAYAAQYPEEVDRIALMDAFLPAVGNWTTVWLLRDLWHFHFYGKTPLALVDGRERIYFEHFWNDFAADPAHSVSEADRQFYTEAYAQPGAMKAGFEVFRAFEQDASDFAGFAQTKLTMPMLVLTGEKASGTFLIEQGRLVAENVEGVVIEGFGHWAHRRGSRPGHAAPGGLLFQVGAMTQLRSSDASRLIEVPRRISPCVEAFRDDHRRPRVSTFDEGEQVGVYRFRLGGRHAVRKALVSLERSVLQQLCRQRGGIGIRHDLVVIAVHHQHRHGDLPQIFGEIGLGEGNDAVIMCLGPAHHALAPPVPDHRL